MGAVPDDDWDEEQTFATGLEEMREKLSGVGSANAKPCLTVLTGSSSGKLFKLQTDGFAVIGRAANAEVRVEDDGISRTHARVRSDGGRAWVEDLSSRNGTYVNGEKLVGPVELREGDKVQLGRSTVLRFGFQDDLDESFHENLLSSALRDGLTKLYNKRYFLERLDSELKFALRHRAALSLLMLDIDYFKKVNDTHGHLAGDTVLATVADKLSRAVRNEDVVARFGGEEIAVVLRAINLDNAVHMAERLRRLVEATEIPCDGKVLRVTVSIGAAGYPSAAIQTPDELVEAADKALYRAKGGGRNRVSL